MNSAADQVVVSGPQMGGRKALGNNYQFCFTPTRNTNTASVTKYRLFKTAKQILIDNARIQSCSADVPRRIREVEVFRGENSAWLKGVWHCANVWACPVCAPRISERRREDLKIGIERAIGMGHGVALVTLTFPHGAGDRLQDILDRFTKAQRRLKSGKRAISLRKRFGVLGEIKTLEVTHGKNGWHPHAHSLWIFEKVPDQGTLDALREELYCNWRASCLKEGLPEPSNAYGVDVRGARHAADYVSKWGFATELSGSTAKRAKAASGGRTPWQLLADAAEGCKRSAWLWREFAQCFHGKRQLLWSRGLRDRLKMREDFFDQEAFDLDEKSKRVISIDLDTWACVVRSESQETVLALAMNASRRELEAFLNGLRASVPRFNGVAPPGEKWKWQW